MRQDITDARLHTRRDLNSYEPLCFETLLGAVGVEIGDQRGFVKLLHFRQTAERLPVYTSFCG